MVRVGGFYNAFREVLNSKNGKLYRWTGGLSFYGSKTLLALYNRTLGFSVGWSTFICMSPSIRHEASFLENLGIKFVRHFSSYNLYLKQDSKYQSRKMVFDDF